MSENLALDLSGGAFDLSAKYISMAAGSPSGNFLLLRADFENTTTPTAGRLVAQVFDASGAPVGGQTTVATNTSTNSDAPHPTDVDGLTGGGFVAAYTANAFNTGGPYAEVDLATFSPSGDLLRTMRLGTSYGTPYASVAPLSNGGFVATWATAEKYQPGFTYLETFDATGAPTSGVTTLSNVTGPLLTVGGQNGSFVAVYFSGYSQRSLVEFNGQAFETPIALPVTDYVQTGTSLSNGNFVFVWSVVQPNEDFKVFAQIYDPSTNTLVGGPAVLHTESGVLTDPHVVSDSNGGYVVSWQSPDYSDGAREAVTVNATGQVSDTFVLTGGVEGVFGTGGSKVLTLGITGGHVHGQTYAFAPGGANARTLHADDTAGERLVGGSGDDVFFAGHNSVVMSGQGGADVFVFDVLPWNAGHIADFTLGVDKLDFSRLFAAAGYTGTDPQQDGRVYFQQESLALADHYETNTKVYFDPDGPGGQGAYLVTTLDNVMSGYSWRTVGGVAPSEPPPPPPTGGGGDGRVYDSPGPGSTVVAGSGDDTINASQGPDVLTGGAGRDAFVYSQLPWNAGHITDFSLGSDRLDLSAIFHASGYSGSDPVADGRIRLDADGHGGTQVYFDRDAPNSGDWPFLITTLDGVAPSGLTWAQLSGGPSGPSPPPPSSEGGQVITAHQAGDTLTGGAGGDTLVASQGPDQLTGNGGADHFVWQNLPWNAGHITDFTPGADKLDLRALFQAAGYSGADPVADHHLEFRPDGAGSTQVYFDRDAIGSGNWPFLITTLDRVAPASITASDWMFQ